MNTAAMWRAISLGAFALAAIGSDTSAYATDRVNRHLMAPSTAKQQQRSEGDAQTVVVVKSSVNASLLEIENPRLETAPPNAPQPSSLLKFDVLNKSSLRLTDLVMRISFVEKRPDSLDAPVRVLIGPVTFRVEDILQSGFVLSYEILFRNLSSDCDCSPTVEVLSARLLPN